MANETNTTTSTVEEMNNEQYIAAIEELKANTVSRDSYNKLRNENKQLLDALVSGQEIPTPTTPKPSIQELRNKMFGEQELSNIEYWKTAVELRDALIEAGERDPWLPVGDKVAITGELIESKQRQAEAFKEMIEFADGDNGIFTAEYQRRVKDPVIPRGRR